MVTVEQSTKFPLVKASTGGASAWGKTSQDGYIYRLLNKLKIFNAGESIGVLTKAWTMIDGNNLGLVQLLKPITKTLTKHTHVLVLLNNIDLVTEKAPMVVNSKMYYSTGSSVNIRKTPSTLGALFPAKLDKGDPIGYSDGIVTNGFLKFELKIGGVGYVSKTYCTLQEPIVPTVTKAVTKTDPMTGKETNVDVPVIQNPESSFDWKKTAIGAGISAVVVYVVTALVKRFIK